MLTLLNIVIGLAAVYTAFSLLASWIQERIATVMQFRSKTLRAGIQQMVNDDATHQALFNQPSFAAAQSPKQRDPSYISATQFSMAVMGIINGASVVGTTGSEALLTVQRGIAGLPASRLKDALATLAGEANADLTRFVSSVENWFDDQMERVSGWYRRYTQVILFVVGAAIAVLFNVDTLRIAQGLTTTPLAINASNLSGDAAAAQQYVSNQVFTQMHFGWPDAFNCPPATSAAECALADTPAKIAIKLIGLLLTTVAISMGAPFWFDTLSRFVNVRGSGPAPPQSASAGS